VSRIHAAFPCLCWLVLCHCSNDSGPAVSHTDGSNAKADVPTAPSGTASTSTPGSSGALPNGGIRGAGGGVGAGGISSTGGTNPAGGAVSSGGAAGASGLTEAGGVTSAAGAASTGGTTSMGGTTVNGGTRSTGGATATGGTTTSGGTTVTGSNAATGGTTAAGESKATGGATATGGNTAVGGTNATSGSKATGGGTATGGNTAVGGTNATGGSKATGGSTGAGGSGTTTSGITCTPQTWDSVPIGWATVSGATTGGGDATPTMVASLSALNSAAGGSGAAVIHVSGKISGVAKVGSNKTILGLCGVEIDGSLDLSGSSNVIVRNLKVVGYNCSDSPSDCSAGSDAVHIQGGDTHLWFDHMDISDGSDGNMDITHGCDFITVSWTKFHYSSQRTDPANNYGHRFSNLIGHSDTNGAEDAGHLNVTFDHVWWADNVAERMPRVRFGKVHVFNSLYTATGDAACIEVGVSCNIRSENNVFQDVTNTVDSSHADSASIIQSIGNQGSSTSINPPAFTPSYSYTLEDVTTVAATVQAGAGPK